MRKAPILAVVALVAAASTAAAQDDTPTMRPEIRPYAGLLVGNGSQGTMFANAPIFGVQAAFEFNPNFHLVASFARVSQDNKFDVADKRSEMTQFDIGIEADAVSRIGDDWQFKPFIGGGVGSRTYSFKSTWLTDRRAGVAYGTLGSEFQVARIALRAEVRGNVFEYKTPLGGDVSTIRDDVAFSIGMAYHIR